MLPNESNNDFAIWFDELFERKLLYNFLIDKLGDFEQSDCYQKIQETIENYFRFRCL